MRAHGQPPEVGEGRPRPYEQPRPVDGVAIQPMETPRAVGTTLRQIVQLGRALLSVGHALVEDRVGRATVHEKFEPQRFQIPRAAVDVIGDLGQQADAPRELNHRGRRPLRERELPRGMLTLDLRTGVPRQKEQAAEHGRLGVGERESMGQRIHRDIVHPQLEVQMNQIRATCPHIAEKITLFHRQRRVQQLLERILTASFLLRAGQGVQRGRETFQMTVDRRQTARVPDENTAPVTDVAAGDPEDLAVERGPGADALPTLRAQVQPGVVVSDAVGADGRGDLRRGVHGVQQPRHREEQRQQGDRHRLTPWRASSRLAPS